MKEKHIKLLEILTSFNAQEIHDAYMQWMKSKDSIVELAAYLHSHGWIVYGAEKPDGENYYFFGYYWVQDPDFEEYKIQQEIMEHRKERLENLRSNMLSKYMEREWKEKAARCPKCGHVMELYPVNAPAGPRNVNGYKSVWRCVHGDCIYEEFSKWSVTTQLKKVGLEHFAPWFR